MEQAGIGTGASAGLRTTPLGTALPRDRSGNNETSERYTNRVAYVICLGLLGAVLFALLVIRIVPPYWHVFTTLMGTVTFVPSALVIFLGLGSFLVFRVDLADGVVVARLMWGSRTLRRDQVETITVNPPLVGDSMAIDFREIDSVVTIRLRNGKTTRLVLMSSGLKRKVLDRLGHTDP